MVLKPCQGTVLAPGLTMSCLGTCSNNTFKKPCRETPLATDPRRSRLLKKKKRLRGDHQHVEAIVRGGLLQRAAAINQPISLCIANTTSDRTSTSCGPGGAELPFFLRDSGVEAWLPAHAVPSLFKRGGPSHSGGEGALEVLGAPLSRSAAIIAYADSH